MKGQNNRAATQHKNGHRRSNSRHNSGSVTGSVSPASPSLPGGSFPSGANAGVAAAAPSDDRLLHLVAKSIGKPVTATLTTGARYQGLLLNGNLAANGHAPLSVVLHKPVLVGKSLIAEKSNVDTEIPERLVINAKDMIDLEVDVDVNEVLPENVDPAPLVSEPEPPQKERETAKEKEPVAFKTDADISGRTHIRERELQRWVPDEDSPAISLDDDTFGSSTGGGRGWDQFEVNEKKFGVESTYDEHLYTTRINTNAPDYHKKLVEAERLAKEIESQSTTDRHLLEERGVQVDDSGLDEEDKYSGVDRRGDELMAALRNTSISTDNSLARGPGKYVPPRQRSAQYHNDPAIISSSGGKSPAPTLPESDAANSPTPTPAAQEPPTKTQPVKPDSIPPKPPTQPHNESFRLNAQSEINALREFSANFKIPHQMPTDLLPILSKDKIKQDEILKKQKETEKKEEPTPPAPRKKMDPTKPAFKLNPKAAAFTPSIKQISPNPPKVNYQPSPNNPSPRMNTRPYSGSISNGSGTGVPMKRVHQISAADFFGGADKIPTKEGQKKKVEDLRFAFNMFVTTKKKHTKDTPVYYEKTYQTPPTWNSTIDETHDKLFPPLHAIKGGAVVMPTSPFVPSPLMGAPALSAYPAPNGSKFPLSPHQQQAAAMAHFQQQQQQQHQFHAAMMYQQQFQMPPGQPPMPMYPGGPDQFLPPGGFIPPPGSFVPGGSPVNGNIMMASPYGANNNQHHNSNYNNHHHGGRRYNQSKRG